MSEETNALRVRQPVEIFREVSKKTIDGTLEDYIHELEMAVAVDPNGYNGCRTAIIVIRHELTSAFLKIVDGGAYTTAIMKKGYKIPSAGNDKTFDNILVRWSSAVSKIILQDKKPYEGSIK
jgi:hypothetical protein